MNKLQYNQKTHRQKSEVIAKREEADRQRREAADAADAKNAEDDPENVAADTISRTAGRVIAGFQRHFR